MLMIEETASILQGLNVNQEAISEVSAALEDGAELSARSSFMGDLFLDEDGWTDDEGAAPGAIDREHSPPGPAGPGRAGSMRDACDGGPARPTPTPPARRLLGSAANTLRERR